MNDAGLLTAYCSPNPLPVTAQPNCDQRNWVVRLLAAPTPALGATEVGAVLTRDAADAVAESRRARGLDVAHGDLLPRVLVHPVDELHLIVTVVSIGLAADEGLTWLVAASAALRSLERWCAIDDLQGIPRRFWKLILGPAGGGNHPVAGPTSELT